MVVPSAGSARRPRPRQAGCGRPRPAAADRGRRVRRSGAGVSAWASRWLTATSGLPRRQRPCALAVISPTMHAADQARPGGGGDAVDVVEPEAGLGQRRLDHAVEQRDMGARGDLRHHAAIGARARRAGEQTTLERIRPCAVASASTTAAAVSSQLVSMPRTIELSIAMCGIAICVLPSPARASYSAAARLTWASPDHPRPAPCKCFPSVIGTRGSRWRSPRRTRCAPGWPLHTD